MSKTSSSPASSIASAPESTENTFEIRVAGTSLDDQPRVLKYGNTFAIFDRYGDINPFGQKGEAGVYHDGTRFLSSLLLTMDGAPMLLLNSAVDEENVVLSADLTNSDSQPQGPSGAPQGTVHIHREKVLGDGSCLEEMHITSYADRPLRVIVSLHFGADFADVFEVRGVQRARRGRLTPAEPTADGLVLPYEGLDGVRRRTKIATEPPPDRIEGTRLVFDLRLMPQIFSVIRLRITCAADGDEPALSTFDAAREHVSAAIHVIGQDACRLRTSNEQFNTWLSRSYADLFMMITNTRHGLYPYAGVPWYNTVFGRDGIITALECLWIMPQLARGVLSFLAAEQSDRHDSRRDAEPGKILHEMRRGEMAALDEIPFGRYYGSADSTPLFVYLAAEYFTRSADREFIAALWPHIERALDWMAEFGDADGDGFLEYSRRTPGSQVHQGWKDSHDAIFHGDGAEPPPPIAVCEVQAYAYAAYRGAARIAAHLGDDRRADELRRRADDLQAKFLEAFWLEDLGTFALALDGDKRPCRVRASNAGHCLYCGIAEPWQAKQVARTLLDGAHFSGWGIRTIDEREARYNPMSYHNGSVWPHDNALIAAGFARYGMLDEANRVLADIFSASTYVDLHRLPELFCGFARRRAQGPTLYPVACSPQVWAAAAVFCFLQASMALRIDAIENRIVLCAPRLPPMLDHLNVFDLRVGNTSVDFRLHRFNGDVGLHVIRKEGNAEVAVLK